MAVIKKEQYRQKDGTDILKVYTKPTSKFPNGGYFYVDAEDEDIVDSYTWGLWKNAKNIYVLATRLDKQHRLHDVLCIKYLHYKPKKKIATHIKPVRTTTYDKDGNIIQERNVQYGTWEPLVDEETWWKAQEIMASRSNSYNLKDDTGKSKRCANGLRRGRIEAYKGTYRLKEACY